MEFIGIQRCVEDTRMEFRGISSVNGWNSYAASEEYNDGI
jgi:hypothetical protein